MTNFPFIPENHSLHPHQKTGVNFLVKKKAGGYRGGFLTDEPGLGKTIQSGVALNFWEYKGYLKDTDKIVIVCPKIMKFTWEAELREWLTFSSKIEVMNKLSDRPSKECTILICTFSWLSNFSLTDPLTKKEYKNKNYWNLRWLTKYFVPKVVIVDESHKAKGHKAHVGKVVASLLKAVPFRISLTGTPMTQGVDDLYMQLLPYVKDPVNNLGRSFYGFRKNYMNRFHNGFGIQYRGIRNEEVLNSVTAPVMLGRKLMEEMKGLAYRQYKNIYIDIPKKIADESLKYVDLAIQQVTGSKEKEHYEKSFYDHVATMKKSLGIAKVRGLFEYVLEVLESEPEHSIVVGCYHKDVIRILSELLSSKNISYDVITGATSDKKREDIKARFQSGKLKLAIVNMDAAGVGITLTASNHCIIGELHWTPHTMEQFIARIHRISQEAKYVRIDLVIAKDSIDQKIIGSVMEKLKTFKQVRRK